MPELSMVIGSGQVDRRVAFRMESQSGQRARGAIRLAVGRLRFDCSCRNGDGRSTIACLLNTDR